VAGVVDAVGNFLTPRGIRDNNPGNIEDPGQAVAWQGLTGLDGVYATFDNPHDGIRAIGHVLLSKAARGLTSVDALIRDYSVTDQDAYVANVAAALGVDPFQSIDVQAMLPQLAAAIINQENGEQPFDLSVITQAVYS
jgi:hypothetical protein